MNQELKQFLVTRLPRLSVALDSLSDRAYPTGWIVPDGEFKEEEHPRDKGGQFTKGGEIDPGDLQKTGLRTATNEEHSEIQPFLERGFRRTPGRFSVKEIPISDLIATQHHINPVTIQKYKTKKSKELPEVFEKGGKYFINDGHHRIEAERLKGKKSAKVAIEHLAQDIAMDAELKQFLTSRLSRLEKPRLAMDKASFIPLKSEADQYVIAMDRGPSLRSMSEDGHLHVADSNISKATVNPYWGKEIPGCDELGLDPDKKYMLLRHPKELAKAAATFNNLPILAEHQPITSDQHPNDLVVGSTGTNAVYKHPYLKNSLVFWTKPAVDAVNSGKQRELSCAYHYDPVMTPGVYEGKRYDGIMTNIRGNHVALVEDGRAGADVVVADAMPKNLKEGSNMSKLSPAGLVTRGALFAYLAPRLAQDAKLDCDALVSGLTSKNYKGKKADIIKNVTALKGKTLAQDADIQDLANLLDALSPTAEQADQQMMTTEPNAGPPMVPPKKENGEDDESSDIVAKIKAYLQQEGVAPEILQNLDAFLAEEGNPAPDLENGPPDNGNGPENGEGDQAVPAMPNTTPPPTGLDENQLEDCVSDQEEESEEERKKREAEDEIVPQEQGEPVTKTAMDAAIKTAVAKAQRDAINNQRAIRVAERFVRPWVGDLAMDAAKPSDVYRMALKALGMDAARVDKMHHDALLPVLEAQPRPGRRVTAPLAADSKSTGGGFFERFPEAGKIVIQ